MRPLGLQSKVILVLVAVVVPIFVVTTLVQNQLTRPALEEELKQIGVQAARSLQTVIKRQRISLAELAKVTKTPDASVSVLDRTIQYLIYSQPSILRIDVLARTSPDEPVRLIASNFEPDVLPEWSSQFRAEIQEDSNSDDERRMTVWDITHPIHATDQLSSPVVGNIHVVVSLRLVGRFAGTLWRTSWIAAFISVIVLVLVLSYLLRRMIERDRKLQRVETQNQELSTQLHEAERQIFQMEKLAAMGQLTASFAHEIGTPLNALGGHLQLLRQELTPSAASPSRLSIIESQLQKIESIVRGFLQNTAKPSSQKQLTDLNALIERTLSIIEPRLQSNDIEVRRSLNRSIAPIRVVPLDLEQVLLNLFNNSIDSLRDKRERVGARAKPRLEVSSRVSKVKGREGVELCVRDSGEGIAPSEIQKVLEPFYTTKTPNRGTGLGLTIVAELVRKYEGDIRIRSREGAWTEVLLWVPYPLGTG